MASTPPPNPRSDEDTTMTDTADASTSPQPSQTTTTAPIAPPRDSPTFSLILDLPRELRDRIYAFALTSPSPFWWPTPTTAHNISPALLRTSRQIYREAAPALYSNNKFLFTHPSDCNMFKIISSEYSTQITSVCFRIREHDLRLWTGYLGSSSPVRSLVNDLPRLRSLWVFLRCGSWEPPVAHPAWAHQHLHQALGQNMNQAQNQNQNIPIPPPPPPPGLAVPLNLPPGPPVAGNQNPNQNLNPNQNQNPNLLLDRFFRWERDPGLENLCLSLQGKTGEAEVKVVCIQRLRRNDVRRLVRNYPDELVLDKQGDARTRFKRVWGVEVSLELSAIDPSPAA